jgi:hypothetical protein
MIRMDSQLSDKLKKGMIEIIDTSLSTISTVKGIRRDTNKRVKIQTKTEITRVVATRSLNIVQNDRLYKMKNLMNNNKRKCDE